MKKRIITALLAAAITAAVLPVTVSAESMKETTVSVEYAAKLSVPENITASKTTDTITLKWDAIEGADRYRVYMFNEDIFNEDIGEFEKYKDVTKTSCKVTELKAKTAYKFKVAALVKGDDGKYEVQEKSDEKIVTTKKLPQPSSVSWSSEKNSITVNWSSVGGADRYGVYVRKQNEGEFEKFKTTSKTSCKITGLSAETSYDVKIIALTEKADGSYTKHTDDDYRSGLSTKKTSSTPKTSSSKVETGAGGYLIFTTPKYGDTKKGIFEKYGEDKFQFSGYNSGRGTMSYVGSFSYKNEVVEVSVLFDVRNRLSAYSITYDRSLGDYNDLFDSKVEKLGKPYSNTFTSGSVFQAMWLTSQGGEMLQYDMNKEKLIETKVFYYD